MEGRIVFTRGDTGRVWPWPATRTVVVGLAKFPPDINRSSGRTRRRLAGRIGRVSRSKLLAPIFKRRSAESWIEKKKNTADHHRSPFLLNSPLSIIIALWEMEIVEWDLDFGGKVRHIPLFLALNRSDREFLYQILGEVIKAGATTLNIPDTVGYNMPNEFGQLIADIKANTKGIENVIISTHCQNDLGLSTANTLAGACAGARQVEVTVNGIGERAGNAALEEVVMALKCRGDQVLGGLYTGINTKQIIMSSKMVEEFSGLHVQPHKAIVGENAFAHESGIHQDGMLKHKNTYEIISPEDIGLHRSNESGIVLGKLSAEESSDDKQNSIAVDTGSNDDRYSWTPCFKISTFRGRLQSHLLQRVKLEFFPSMPSINSSALLPLQLGYDIDSKDLDDLFWRFKAVAEKKKNITDDDVMALVSDVVFQPQVVWKLGDVQVTCGTLGLPMATVRLIDANGEEHIACANGTGPIDSAYKAVLLIVKV
ncbi:hypothetical protein C3L33_17538, partial [Rhododendron williamsianum]